VAQEELHGIAMDREERLAGVDFMRAVACLLVLLHHFVLRLDVGRVPGELRPALDTARFGNFGVAIFFVLSGFLLARPFWQTLDRGATLPKLKIYALRRAARILPGFWVALTAAFLLSFTVFGYAVTPELVLRYATGFFLMSQWHWRTFFPVGSNGPLWSIPFEATCYVLLPICFLALHGLRLGRRRIVSRLAWIAFIAVLLIGHVLIVRTFQTDAVGRGWAYGLQGGAKEWMPRYNPIGFFAIFALGTLAAGMQTLLPTRRTFSFDIIASLALGVAMTGLITSTGGDWEGYGWLGIPYGFPIFPLAIATALVTLPRSLLLGALDSTFFRYTATVSFGIYIWQDIVISLTKEFLPSSFGTGAQSAITGWLLSCVAVACLLYAVASLSYFLLERPVLRWAHGFHS
jgi:peptidoglycan/LPS O-acetylase OafA/YrhL